MTDAHAAARGVGVVVVAAGSGSRLGAAVPKAFVPLAGRPLLAWALDTVAGVPGVVSVVVVAPAALADPSGPQWSGVTLPVGARVVAGGSERTDSVAAGLAALDPACHVVLVHDAARCLTPVGVFERVVAGVRAGYAGVVPGVPVVDTVKAVDERGVVTGTPQRSALRAVQTPQGFRRDVLEAAHAGGSGATDDAALVEALGHEVLVVDGDARAFKVTTVDDLAHAERLLAADPGRSPAGRP
ncbi:2-C-methyl-D-erythritol 4-phosphate cytidylyltransferase [Phycicoccus sonneratiae]|uniref:2-C-methyl-D-erythritol 4-phosphate cytidylyltransferase n=1 Tax=Phycicoccus sonneratiae TaxID=2807628 RepID=A0ABS2CR08_9MICO|nr:2-C-methyl-D-erythritol 4-phosphate cytidylyltransferase [Phycicoccus sonneraticus]MBM6401499.1 2-C-methyl-D-erythritol 4-phosphate cytidylyltransferase [Phycicoccus sonneraticus]